MANCITCRYAVHEQFDGYNGRWICFHPFRRELDNKGEFTYPSIGDCKVIICDTPKRNGQKIRRKALVQAETPVWCYYEACKREQARNPYFDPSKQRQVLYDVEV